MNYLTFKSLIIPKLDEDGWNILFRNLNRIREACEAQGVDAVLHPHYGTMIETRDDVMQVIQGSNIKFCLDTGHMYLGGTDPVFSHKIIQIVLAMFI